MSVLGLPGKLTILESELLEVYLFIFHYGFETSYYQLDKKSSPIAMARKGLYPNFS